MAEQAAVLNENGELVKEEIKKEGLLDKLTKPKPKTEVKVEKKPKEISVQEFESMKKIVFENASYAELKQWSELKFNALVDAMVQENVSLKNELVVYKDIVSKLKQ